MIKMWRSGICTPSEIEIMMEVEYYIAKLKEKQIPKMKQKNNHSTENNE